MEKYRIVSLVPSLTEMLVDLGLRDVIVGVTKFCVHPAYLRKEVEVVGGTKNPSIDKILRLAPTHIIANKEENRRADIKYLLKYTNVHVSDIKSMDDVFELLRTYATLFKVRERAIHIEKTLREEIVQFQIKVPIQPPIKVAYMIWKNPWLSIGHDTFIHEMLSIAGFENVYADQKRYPEVNLNELSANNIVFLSSEPFPFTTIHLKEVKKFVKHCFLVNGECFSWYGTRLLTSFTYLSELRAEVKASLNKRV